MNLSRHLRPTFDPQKPTAPLIGHDQPFDGGLFAIDRRGAAAGRYVDYTVERIVLYETNEMTPVAKKRELIAVPHRLDDLTIILLRARRKRCQIP